MINPFNGVAYKLSRNCINISHLRAGSNAENVADREARGRNIVQYGEDCHFSILKEEDVIFIKDELSKITTKRSSVPNQLAKKYNVSVHTIYKIRSGHNWNWTNK